MTVIGSENAINTCIATNKRIISIICVAEKIRANPIACHRDVRSSTNTEDRSVFAWPGPRACKNPSATVSQNINRKSP